MTLLCTAILIVCMVEPGTNDVVPSRLRSNDAVISAVAEMTNYQRRLHSGFVEFFDKIGSDDRLKAASILYKNEVPVQAFHALLEAFGQSFLRYFTGGKPALFVQRGRSYHLVPDAEAAWVSFHREYSNFLLIAPHSLERRLLSLR